MYVCMYSCMYVHMYVCMHVCSSLLYIAMCFYYFTVPGEVGMVNLTYGAMDLINSCYAAWNVSV